ncbi:MAG: TIGR01777 family protein [Caldithrix sp.]|nr:TIGR01777 family protein [Caldithrix sp.]
MNILLTGATGFIGKELCKHLADEGHQLVILTRNPQRASNTLGPSHEYIQWLEKDSTPWMEVLEDVDGIIHLMGENVGSGLWTAAKREKILNSRVKSGQLLVEALQKTNHKPEFLIQASGVNYYGSSADGAIDETADSGQGFLADVTRAWEDSTAPVEEMGVRRIIIRTGMVLEKGGALDKMALPFRFFMGGPIGGWQWVSWIHLIDEVRAIHFLTTDAHRGVYNLCAPNPVRQREFSRALGKSLKRPSWLPVPAWAVRLLMGQMAEETVLSNLQVKPNRLLQAGFEFKYTHIQNALQDIFS